MSDSTTNDAAGNPLLGYWKVIACQLNSEWLHPSIFENFRYDLNPGTFFIHRAECSWYPSWVGSFPKHHEGSMSVDFEKKTIDLSPSGGPNEGKVYQGIFELDHDILKANFGLPGEPRPTSFKAQQGQVYEVWQRVDHPKSY